MEKRTWNRYCTEIALDLSVCLSATKEQNIQYTWVSSPGRIKYMLLFRWYNFPRQSKNISSKYEAHNIVVCHTLNLFFKEQWRLSRKSKIANLDVLCKVDIVLIFCIFVISSILIIFFKILTNRKARERLVTQKLENLASIPSITFSIENAYNPTLYTICRKNKIGVTMTIQLGKNDKLNLYNKSIFSKIFGDACMSVY